MYYAILSGVTIASQNENCDDTIATAEIPLEKLLQLILRSCSFISLLLPM